MRLAELSLTLSLAPSHLHRPFHERAAGAAVIQHFAASCVTSREEAASDAWPAHILHPRRHCEPEYCPLHALQLAFCSLHAAERPTHGERHRVVDPIVLKFAVLERVAQVLDCVTGVGIHDSVLWCEEAHHRERQRRVGWCCAGFVVVIEGVGFRVHKDDGLAGGCEAVGVVAVACEKGDFWAVVDCAAGVCTVG